MSGVRYSLRNTRVCLGGGDFPEAAHDQADFQTKPIVRSQSLAMYNVVGIELQCTSEVV